MKPKHHKTIRCSRQKKQKQHHHHYHMSIDYTGTLAVAVDIVHNEKSDTDDNDEGPLAKSFSAKCSTETGSHNSKMSAFKKVKDDKEDDSDLEIERYNAMFRTVREGREQLVDRLRIYNNLFKFHKSIKEDQVYLYRKLQDMDELYLRNTAAILRLGFCPCLVHQQTSPVGDLLMRIHRKLRVWDKKMESICETLKEPSSRKTTAAVLQILKVCESQVNLGPGQADFNDIALPEIVWDLDNPFLENLNSSTLTEDWRSVKIEVQECLCRAEIKFQEICLEFGITRGPEQTPSSESESRAYTYENMSMSTACDEIGSNQQPLNPTEDIIDECGDEDASSSIDTNDTPHSKVSSSFL